MLTLEWGKLKTVLCLGAHSDDIEIGCGGTLLKLLKERPNLNIVWVVFSAEGSRSREAKASARAFLQSAVRPRILVKSFRTSFFPFQGVAIKEFFEKLKSMVQPDLVLTHYREDRHQDHRVLSDLAWNTFRNHLVLEYEIPKYDGDLGTPNFYVPVDERFVREKIKNLCAFFQTQNNKHWFAEDTFLSLMRLRGIECVAPYAEAFYARKIAV